MVRIKCGKNQVDIFNTRYRISVINMLAAKYSLYSKIEVLRKHFEIGSFLESFEDSVEFPTLHFEYSERKMKCQDLKIEESCFEASVANFLEISLFKSTENVLDRKCFLVLGFKTPEDGSIDYFISNWRELTGLGNILLFLSQKYVVRRVMFMKNMASVGRDDNMFQFLLMLEVFHKQGDLIYLLDFVQQNRNWRNVGFISLYGEIPANVQD